MLQAVLRHCWETVPYYQQQWRSLGLHPDAVRRLEDLAQFPVLSKSDIRRHGERLRSESYAGQQLRIKSTSGSTGVPLKIAINEEAVQWKYACTLRADQWSGYKLGQAVAKAWGNPEYLHFGWRGKLINGLVDRAIHLDTLNLTRQRLADFTAKLRRHKPGLIFGHAHSLYLLANYLRQQNVTDVRPNGIISTAMPLHQWQRAVIEEVFGTPATNRYGCEEVSLIASECEQHHGLHVAAESVFTEVEPDGHLLVTDLVNFAMPLIRYRLGDVVAKLDDPCPCGRGLPRLASVEGRDADYVVTPSGSLISGISLTENFAVLIDGTAQVQLIQEELTRLRVRLVPDERFGETSRTQLAELVNKTFGPTMRYELELVDAIPQEPSGKYRFCISKVSAELVNGLTA